MEIFKKVNNDGMIVLIVMYENDIVVMIWQVICLWDGFIEFNGSFVVVILNILGYD